MPPEEDRDTTGARFWNGAMYVPLSPEWKQSLRNLKPGWDTYDSKPIAEAAITAVENAFQCFQEMPDITPCSNGGIQVEWHNHGVNIEIEFSPEGEQVFDSGTEREIRNETAAEIKRLRFWLERILALGHNDECLFCGLKDKQARGAVAAPLVEQKERNAPV